MDHNEKTELTVLLKDVISEVVSVEFEKMHVCPIPKDKADEISHMLGVIVDVGDGDLRKGVENIREHHTFIKGLIATRSRMTRVISASVIVSLVSAFLAMLIFAIKESLSHLVGN